VGGSQRCRGDWDWKKFSNESGRRKKKGKENSRVKNLRKERKRKEELQGEKTNSKSVNRGKVRLKTGYDDRGETAEKVMA